jgi:hypothetical protein
MGRAKTKTQQPAGKLTRLSVSHNTSHAFLSSMLTANYLREFDGLMTRAEAALWHQTAVVKNYKVNCQRKLRPKNGPGVNLQAN